MEKEYEVLKKFLEKKNLTDKQLRDLYENEYFIIAAKDLLDYYNDIEMYQNDDYPYEDTEVLEWLKSQESRLDLISANKEYKMLYDDEVYYIYPINR